MVKPSVRDRAAETARAIERHAAARERWPGVTIAIDDDHGRYFFDEIEAARVVRFFPTFLKHFKGEFAGQKFELLDWQRLLLIEPMFGWMRSDNGLRRFRFCFLEVAKKNGKSGLLSGLGLYLLHGDLEPGAEIISAASDREQAGIIFNLSRDMNAASPHLARGSDTFKRAIVVPSTMSSYKVVSADANSLHGPNIHGLLFDELHAQRDRELYETLTKGVAARQQPVTVIITTAGVDQDSICYEEYERAKHVIGGARKEDGYLPIVFEAAPEDDWTSPATWAKANPSLGVTLKLQHLQAECATALNEPRKQAGFRRFHLNQWTQTDETWIPVDWWTACPKPPADAELLTATRAAGLDLSTTEDLTALVIVFRLPPSKKDKLKIEEVKPTPDGKQARSTLAVAYDLAVVPYLWMPEARVAERTKEDRIDYGSWVRRGFLRVTPGDIVDYDVIFRTIVEEIAPKWKVKEIGFDPWNASQFALNLAKEGFNVVAVRQGAQTLSTPCKVFHALVKCGRVRHDGNEAMTWCVGNTAVREDENENLRPIKRNKRRRIDGTVAALTALARLMVMPDGGNTPYAKRGVRFV